MKSDEGVLGSFWIRYSLFHIRYSRICPPPIAAR